MHIINLIYIQVDSNYLYVYIIDIHSENYLKIFIYMMNFKQKQSPSVR